MSVSLRRYLLTHAFTLTVAAATGACFGGSAIAQDSPPSDSPQASPETEAPALPEVQVIQSPQLQAARKKAVKKAAGSKKKSAVANAAPKPVNEAGDQNATQAITLPGTRSGSLTVPTAAEARAEIQQWPGGVEVVPDTAFKDGPARTVKDILGWVPGVLVQPRWGPDARLSIRGSGLSRNYGNRGINMFMDGIPINTSDGLFDLFEVDPSAYRYVEVFKGANALRFGANSLGGAINFVTPTGRDANIFESRVDAGSFGYIRGQTSTGAASGPWDWFATFSAERQDGYREHSEGHAERLNANLGYRFSSDAETRFYINANSWRARLPGEVSKDSALNTPRKANAEFMALDEQRNIDSLRIANKTTLRFGPTTVDFGVFTHIRDVDHPIYLYLDYGVTDYGGFVRATDDRMIGDFRNQFIIGFNSIDGTTSYREYVNTGNATKGPLVTSKLWSAQNHSLYAENSFYFVPDAALVTGGQFMYAVRDQEDRLGDKSGSRSYSLFSPKVGLLWNVSPTWQVFGNISRSAEVPTFDANSFATPASSDLEAQTATTYEIGTRGQTADFKWDVSLYRANIKNELQCLTTSPYSLCTVVNADRTIHQGIEAGFGYAFLRSVYAQDDSFWFNVNYTLNDFFFDNDADHGDNRLPGVPRHHLRAELLYKQANGFYVGPNVEWVPQAYYADNANTVTVDPFELFNFRIGIEREKGWSAYLEGRNLFDKRYISAVLNADTATEASEIFSPGDGRAIYGGAHYRW